ncbi:hypothetical protein HPB51_002915 [Rhipicephalus microplus]|uniref:Low-density lipoprotein receptor n=1 Tax=Rhipicephalus microplus TaxID=6941 RepID=A0A9J6DSC3_RHIMP|nr:hypothetical protein HPB51_002915 [Rhipicephalus microplus]
MGGACFEYLTSFARPAQSKVVTWQSKTTAAPATTEPLPPVVCKRGEFKCRTENTCIPGSLLCDGVYDCLDGLDEKCGSGAQCKENEFFCVTRTPSACLPRSLLCDDQEDCVGGSDEALCGASGSAGAVATGVIVVFAIVIIGVVAAIVIMRKRRIARKSPVYIDNPSYDASTDEIKIFAASQQVTGLQVRPHMQGDHMTMRAQCENLLKERSEKARVGWRVTE